MATIPSASPAVNFREIDLTGRVQSETSSTGAIVGNFMWGPVDSPVLVSNEAGLVSTFGSPSTDNSIDFHNAASFLRYSDTLNVVRMVDSDGLNARAEATAAAPLIKNAVDFDGQQSALGDSDHTFIARYPGTMGNGLTIQICPNGAFDGWTYENEFDGEPATSVYADARDGTNDEVHIVVVDTLGAFTGTPGTVLETFPYVSMATDAKTYDGTSNYAVDVVNARSQYVWMVGWDSDYTNTGAAGTATTAGTPKDFDGAGLEVGEFELSGGVDSGALAQAEYLAGIDNHFTDPETTTIDFIIAPSLSAQSDQASLISDYVATAEGRKDCLVVASPGRSGVTSGTSQNSTVVTFAASLPSSSYLVVDNNFLKVYDKYNDKYIFIPAAPSTAGLMAATEQNSAPWFSPAGTRRGNYLGVAGLAYNPIKAERDALYKVGINPIANLPGTGILLYGDKTRLLRPSAFDRINVRRLFLVMERAISRYAKDILFEFNDEFTRAQFVGVVEPYLRDIQAGRGITDYQVVCDETNNPPSIVDNNEFVASVFVKPARSINFITLNFVAVRTGVSFEEVVGTV